MSRYHVIELPELHVGHGLPRRVGEVWLTRLTQRHPHLASERAELLRLLVPLPHADTRGVESVYLHLPDTVPAEDVFGLARELSDWYPSVNLHVDVPATGAERPIPDGETYLRAVLIDGIDITETKGA